MAHRDNKPENTILQIEDGDVVHYIFQDGIALTERDFDGELAPPEMVGTAKRGTGATHLIQGEDKRAIYCISEENVLQDLEFDGENDAVWMPGQLVNLGVGVMPGTKLAAVLIGEASLIVSQDTSGAIQIVHRDHHEAEWQIMTGLPHTLPLPAASIHATRVGSSALIFYAHQDNSIHELSLVDEKWNDCEVAGTSSQYQKSHISALVEGSGECTLRFADETSAAYVLDNEEAVLVGRITAQGFRRLHDAEGHGPKELKW